MRLLLLLLFIALIPNALAIEDSIALLTVGGPNSSVGGIASVKLEITKGTGRVFIDSYPLSQLDTQFSTRFAKEVSCNFLEIDCSKLDFFYTIRASSGVIGGPSAGGALAVLTTAMLDGQKLDKKIAMTGTINGGGTIGAVGGIPAKVDAAQKNGFEKVIIPKFAGENITNKTIQVIEVETLSQALKEFTNKDYSEEETIVETEEYTKLMSLVSKEICEVTNNYFSKEYNKSEYLYNLSEYYYNRSVNALEENDYYSAASYCFSANIRLRTLNLESQNDLSKELDLLQKRINEFNEELEKRELDSLTKLETYMIVKERIIESQEVLDKINRSNITASSLGYAIERYNSAVSWSKFFSLKGKKINLDNEHLRRACLDKLSEAEERVSYVAYRFPVFSNQELSKAYESKEEGNWGLCLFQGTKAKAEVNAIIDASGAGANQTVELIESKLKIARNVIAKQQKKDQFPILGYSYYKYSNSLNGQDTTNALVFAEYALEFSNLDIYFPRELKEPTIFENSKFDAVPMILSFLAGVIVSTAFFIMINPGRNPPKKKSPRKKR